MSSDLPENPFAVWQVFRGFPSWCLARSYPPTISRLSGWSRVLHAAVLMASLGLMGALAGLVSVWLLIQVGLTDPWLEGVLGLAIGVFLIAPLSLWIGRPWWLAALAIPACGVWFGTLQSWWDRYWDLFANGGSQQELTWSATTTTIGLGLGLAMISPRNRRSYWIPLGVLVGCLIASAAELFKDDWLSGAAAVAGNSAVAFIITVQPIVVFIVGTAIALGIPLWFDETSASQPQSMASAGRRSEMFAVWTAFRGFPRCWFSRSLPPGLRPDVAAVRVVRAAVLLGTLGLVSSWVSTLWLVVERFAPWISAPGFLEGTLVFSPGAWFGLLVMVPLSRWLGRGWILSLLLVPVSVGVYYGAVVLYLNDPFGEKTFYSMTSGGMTCGLWGGFGVSLWFIDWHRPRTWLLVPWTAFIGGLMTWGMTIVPDTGRPGVTFVPDIAFELLAMNLLLSPFQVVVAMALGLRLWWMPYYLAPGLPTGGQCFIDTDDTNI